MSSDHARLLRLARAQGEVSRLQEMKLLAAEARIAQLRNSREEIDRLSRSEQSFELAIIHSAQRRLTDIDKSLEEAASAADAIRRNLIAGRSREKSLAAKGSAMEEAWERKRTEEQSLETSLAMAATGSGKHRLVK